MNARDIRLVEVVSANPHISSADLSSAFDISERTLRTYVRRTTRSSTESPVSIVIVEAVIACSSMMSRPGSPGSRRTAATVCAPRRPLPLSASLIL